MEFQGLETFNSVLVQYIQSYSLFFKHISYKIDGLESHPLCI